jgi:hypothetical protein
MTPNSIVDRSLLWLADLLLSCVVGAYYVLRWIEGLVTSVAFGLLVRSLERISEAKRKKLLNELAGDDE